MQPIITIAIIFLEFVSLLCSLYIAYFIWLRWKNEEGAHDPLKLDLGFVAASFLFVALIFASLWGAHRLSADGTILDAASLLGGSFVVAGFLYGGYLRNRWDDDRIRYAVLLWATLWAVIVFFLFVAWHWRDLKPDESALQVINNAAQILGIVIAAAMIVITNHLNSKQQNATAQHKIYQTLELQSVQLFQWECEHPQFAKMFWFAENPPRDELKRHLLRQYICQTLNLFEMAVRFRRQKIVAPEVFGSWVIWMWEVCRAPVFQKLWGGEGGIWTNYVAEFRRIMTRGIEITREPGNEASQRKAFFKFVGELFDCEDVEHWMDISVQDFRQRK